MENNKEEENDEYKVDTGRDEKGRFTEKNFWAQAYKLNNGRRRLYDSPEEMATVGLMYFQWSSTVTKTPKFTEAGLRGFLGLSKQLWHEYKKRPEYEDIIAYFDTVLEDQNEQRLSWAGSTQGAIFWLKNKAGWKDEITQNQNQTVTTVQPQIIKPENTPPLASNEGEIKLD